MLLRCKLPGLSFVLVIFLGLMLSACEKATESDSTKDVSAKTAVPIAKPFKLVRQFPPPTVSMKLVQVSPNIYYVKGKAGIATDNEGFVSNAGFVVTSEGVVVFDALGTPALAESFLEKIRSVTNKPIKKLIVSHYHADHIYGIQIFKQLGAEVIAPKGSYDYLDAPIATERLDERRFSLSPWVNDKTRLVSPDKIIDKETRFSLGGIEFVMSVLGKAHSDGDMTMYIPSEKVLFSGDIIFEGRVPYLGDSDTKQWLQTLNTMQTGKLIALIPGHGPAAKDPNKAIAATRHYLAYMREKMGKAVEDFVDFDDVYSATDWSDFSKLPAFEAANRKNAYQVYLSMESEALAAN